MSEDLADPGERLQSLQAFPTAKRAHLLGVLADVDDTLTTEGRLTADAYSALERLQSAGYLVIPITGRPAGWCDHIARMWPVDGVVGENGAFYFRYLHKEKRLVRRFVDDDVVRIEKRAKLAALKKEILAEIPGTAVASDQPYREADLAIDYCEDVPRLDSAAVQAIVERFRAAGATAKISSIHVNGWFGDYDKLSMTRILLREAFDLDLDQVSERFVFAGDSPNDAPMFGFFENSVGVANVTDFIGGIEVLPAYLTRRRGGAGFAELAEVILAASE